MFKILRGLIGPIVEIVIAPWLLSKVIRNQNDAARAQTIEIIARAAAAQLVAENPNAEWAKLVNLLILQLGDAIPPGVRTDNAQVLRRVSEAALRAAAPAKFPGGK